MWVSGSVSINFWGKPLGGVILDSCLQGSINSVTDWFSPMGWVSLVGHFLQSMLRLCPGTTCRQDILWVEGFVGGFLYLSLLWKSRMATGGGHSQAPYLPMLGISARVTFIDFIGLPLSQVSEKFH